MARAWRTVRALPRKERAELASRLGLEGAEEILERLATSERDGRVSSADVLRLLDEAEKSDPRRMADLLHEMRDPRERKEMALKAAEALAKEFTAPDEEEKRKSPPTPTPAIPPESSKVVAPPPAPAPPTPLPLALQPPSPPLAPIPYPIASARPPEEPAHRSPAEEFAEAGSPGAAGGHGDGPVAIFASRLAGAPLAVRFRLLRLELAAGKVPFSFGDVERALEAFPEGWARRRALASFLRAGVPEDLTECQRLIERLESPRARAFCLAAIAGRRAVTES